MIMINAESIENRKTDTYMLVNERTNQKIRTGIIPDTLEKKKKRDKFAKKKVVNEKFKDFNNEYLGNFVFFIYKNMDLLSEILTDVELVRYIYLGTYVKYDGILKLDNNKTIIDKKQMRKLLQIADNKVFNKYYKKLVERDLITETNEGIMINFAYFYRGSESEYKKFTGAVEGFDDDFTRLYINTTRELYESTDNRKKKNLNIIYKLLPYVNSKFNILCKNPNELDKDEIDPITVGDVMDLLGYDKTNVTRFKKDFYSIKTSAGYIFKSVEGHEGYLGSMVIVNPRLYYKGDNIEEVNVLLALFK
ncbi:hypothetical protein [Clostridium cylindrosporum]|uniref:Uncharacterized protein n=1 Tax=Clostridium cylindrosporum DSM 605 TaxID=1121307 RepID=A0A0J8D6P0_CLOCY|nr:hypothetical protein [Clostridium cylindrosporum]KMT21507.1 hypothetical protein CLCY_2c02680 [Clostridium cylindrosporum DSM 605]